MAVLHNFICSECQRIVVDLPLEAEGHSCLKCNGGGHLEIFYGKWGRSRNAAPLSKKSACVVYKHPQTGKVIYPGRNDVPMPERYRQQGYERVEMRSLGEIVKFSNEHGVINEKANYSSGNSYDSERGRK